MSYDINILVNGSRCKQYHHNGRLFIEAKDGSEYSLEIKNNTWRRILAVFSVDGLNILDGNTATDDGPGYVINGYTSNRFDGFRVSNTQVAKFVFGKKGQSYAASKEDGSERNVGVIGVRVYEELIKPQPIILHSTTTWTAEPVYGNPRGLTSDPIPPQPTIWCSTADMGEPLGFMEPEYERSSEPPTKGSSAKYSCDNIKTRTCSTSQDNMMKGLTRGLCSMAPEPVQEAFDMGTKWGAAKESRIVEVEFDRGILALNMDVYYASRQSLIEMGVPIGNEKQVNFPSSFADTKYAKPPKNWQG